MLEGVITVVITTIIAVIGVLCDTAKRVGLRWTLLVLIVAGSVVALVQEDRREKQVEQERRQVEKERQIAAQDRLSAQQAREKAEAERKEMAERLDTLIEQTLALYSKIDEMESAAKSAGNQQVADLGRMAKLDSAKAMLPVLKRQNLLSKSAIKQIETKLRAGPLSAQQFKDMQKSGKSR